MEKGQEREQGKMCAHNKIIKIGYTIENDSFFLRYISFPLPL